MWHERAKFDEPKRQTRNAELLQAFAGPVSEGQQLNVC